MKRLIVAVLAMLVSPSIFAQSSQSCPIGTEDMMNYFVMGYPNRLNHYMGPGNSNPIYTDIAPDLGTSFATSGQFEWIKSAIGYPWDIKIFDPNYVYDRSTELKWSDPTSFKRFNTDLPMSTRCVTLNGAGAAIKIPSSKTTYTLYENCLPIKTQPLSYVVNTISAPTPVNFGSVLGSVKTRYFTYRYSCNSNYESCKYQEVFSLGYKVGPYDWKYYVNQNGTFVLVKDAIKNHFATGSATPYLPCSSSYK